MILFYRAFSFLSSYTFTFTYTFTFDLYFLFPAAIAQIFNPVAELVIPIGIPIKEAKAEIEIHPVNVEAKMWPRSI